MSPLGPVKKSGYTAAGFFVAGAIAFAGVAVSTYAQPDPAPVKSGKAHTIGIEAARDLLEQFGGTSIRYVKGPIELEVIDGALIRLDAHLASREGLAMEGDRFIEGVWINGRADEPTIVMLDDIPLYVAPDGVVAVLADGVEKQEIVSCEVTCGEGYYACCKEDPILLCLCAPNGEVAQGCVAGGPGSVNCSASTGGGGGGGGEDSDALFEP